MLPQYKTIDLCAGIGGIRKGFELTGRFQNVVSAEIDCSACKTYEHLFHEMPQNDITCLKFKKYLCTIDYDVLLAGFPCQSFSSVGLQLGFEDKTKGTIFFDIAQIIQDTRPKAVFLENVQNLLTHDKGNTFRTIIETLENDLDYMVVGVTRNTDGKLHYDSKSFIRNSKNFGIPQNRPRAYIVAFRRTLLSEYLVSTPLQLPSSRQYPIYNSLCDLLDTDVDAKYFLSAGYLETLENHFVRQKSKGNGFGYRIINALGIETPVANTLMATGGSGKERNLLLDTINGPKHAGSIVKGKYSPINKKCIRTMTPNEWARLQGFLNYAFLDDDGNDQFSFPDNLANAQKYKQLGNSVTIPVIEEMARFVLTCLDSMNTTTKNHL